MCVLCGELIMNAHWTENHNRENGMTDQRRRRRSRIKRAVLSNRILSYYGLQLAEWNGTKYVLSDKKGSTLIIQDMGDMWPAVQKMSGHLPDPLDPRLWQHLKEEGCRHE